MFEGNVITPVASGEPKPAPAAAVPLPAGGGRQESPPVQEEKAAPPAPRMTVEQARDLAKELNERLDVNKFRVEVSVDEPTRSFVFAIYHRSTGKLIRQFPPEGILLMAQRLLAAQSNGLLLDAQA